MKESYREGVASHPGPQPCEGGREAALEAWERGIRRQGIGKLGTDETFTGFIWRGKRFLW